MNNCLSIIFHKIIILSFRIGRVVIQKPKIYNESTDSSLVNYFVDKIEHKL